MRILFLHGLESGPHGSKYNALKNAGYLVTAPDCEGVMDVTERVMIAKKALEALDEPCVIVGSSFGGLTAKVLYTLVAGSKLEDKIAGFVLCAPAFHRPEVKAIAYSHPNTIVLHGIDDEIVPHGASVAWCKTNDSLLVSVMDGHRLSDSHAILLRLVDRAWRNANV